jgi:exodeoxyribonuclease VII small subunit
MTKQHTTIAQDLEELEAIAAWFESSEQVDVEEGLKKVKRGAELAARLKERLKEVENEFEEVKKGVSVG